MLRREVGRAQLRPVVNLTLSLLVALASLTPAAYLFYDAASYHALRRIGASEYVGWGEEAKTANVALDPNNGVQTITLGNEATSSFVVHGNTVLYGDVEIHGHVTYAHDRRRSAK